MDQTFVAIYNSTGEFRYGLFFKDEVDATYFAIGVNTCRETDGNSAYRLPADKDSLLENIGLEGYKKALNAIAYPFANTNHPRAGKLHKLSLWDRIVFSFRFILGLT